MTAIDDAMTEAELQALVVDAADLGGWLVYHTHDSRRSRPGFPDLVMVRGDELIMVELKSAKGRIRPDQQAWIDALSKIDKLTVAIVRPAEADWLVRRLTS